MIPIYLYDCTYHDSNLFIWYTYHDTTLVTIQISWDWLVIQILLCILFCPQQINSNDFFCKLPARKIFFVWNFSASSESAKVLFLEKCARINRCLYWTQRRGICFQFHQKERIQAVCINGPHTEGDFTNQRNVELDDSDLRQTLNPEQTLNRQTLNLEQTLNQEQTSTYGNIAPRNIKTRAELFNRASEKGHIWPLMQSLLQEHQHNQKQVDGETDNIFCFSSIPIWFLIKYII